jgi:hypothetical protein
VQNGKKDTNNTGNVVTRFAAPTINCFSTSPFALETFEAAANTRFAPPLVESGNDPQQEVIAWQPGHQHQPRRRRQNIHVVRAGFRAAR